MRSGARLALAMSLGLGVALSWAPIATGQGTVVLPKPGQVGLAVGGGYGALLESGNVGGRFDAGPTFTVRLRYRMRYERALALSFEAQSFDARREAPVFRPGDPTTEAPTRLSLIASGFELCQMFDTRTRTVKMLMAGAGLAQLRADFNTGDVQFSGEHSGDGVYVSLGAGVERFFFRSWAYDLSGRYLAVFRDGKANHDLQVALGVIFYASY